MSAQDKIKQLITDVADLKAKKEDVTNMKKSYADFVTSYNASQTVLLASIKDAQDKLNLLNSKYDVLDARLKSFESI